MEMMILADGAEQEEEELKRAEFSRNNWKQKRNGEKEGNLWKYKELAEFLKIAK